MTSVARAIWTASVQQNVFRLGFKVAFPCALCTAVLKYFDVSGGFGKSNVIGKLVDSSVFSNLTFLIGLFLAFRASHAYSRFWNGTCALFGISADFYDVASSLVTFSRNSTAHQNEVMVFRHLMVRLFSMLHALILADLEAVGHITGNEQAFSYELIDLQGINYESLVQLRDAGPRQVDVVYQWIQSVIVEAQSSGVLSVPPPILSRVFQELNSGIMEYHRTLALTEVPFPVPYSAATHCVLVFHWVLTPMIACTWSEHIWVVACLSFVQVFMLWSLNAIAQELENPFGKDLNDLDTHAYHSELNERLIFLVNISCRETPKLSAGADMSFTKWKQLRHSYSFESYWSESQSSPSVSPCAMNKSDRDGTPKSLKSDEVHRNCGSTIVTKGCQPSGHATFQSPAFDSCDLPDLEWAAATESNTVDDLTHEALRIEALNFDAPWKRGAVRSGSCSEDVSRHAASHSNLSGRALDKLHSNAHGGLACQPASLDVNPEGTVSVNHIQEGDSYVHCAVPISSVKPSQAQSIVCLGH